MSAKKVTLMLICCLLVVLCAAVCVLLGLYPHGGLVADAAGEGRGKFVIATEDGNNWTLSFNGENLDGKECSGRFGSLDGQSVARKMYEAMRDHLRAIGAQVPSTGEFAVAEYCDIEFSLPQITSSVSDNTAIYGANGVFFNASVGDIISTPNVSFEYRVSGGEWQEAKATPTAGGYYFGKGVSVGTYEVRLVSAESFNYESDSQDKPFAYTVKRYGEACECTLDKADITATKSVEKSVIYGQSLADIAKTLKIADFSDIDISGRFVPSESQTDEAISSAADKSSIYLGVNEGGHTVFYDFIPDNANYNALKDLPVQVTISPRSLFVRIHDAYSLVGEELVFPTCKIYTPLVEGDTVASLGARIEHRADKDVASMSYRTYVVFDNPNYVADCLSFESNFANYGRYFVYAKQIEIVTEDGRIFYVFYGEGLVDVEIRVSKVEVENTYGKTLAAAYKFEFLDENGNDVTPEDGFSVSWKSAFDDIKYVAVYGVEDLLDISVGGVTLSKANNVLCLFEGEKAVDVLTPANVALIVVCSALACVLVALCIAWKKQRRYLV